MDSKLSSSDALVDEFNTIAFEKKLTGLKDSQDSINSCCQWCLQNRQHHKKIVSSWLNVLKRVKIEHRLTLFYLANDVIQYSKRRNYDFVESWGTTLQKATTMVRDEKIKHKVLRIFKIWEERTIYGEEFIADLSGLISASPSIKKDDTHEFQLNYLIQKIDNCTKLENDTDLKLKQLKQHNPSIQIDGELIMSSFKDRDHIDEVEKELNTYAKQMENYINALKHEIKSRIQVISLLSQSEVQLTNDKRDVKVIANAYKAYAIRVKAVQKKLEEKLPAISSPVPSPDVNAPSPTSDADIELPTTTTATTINPVPPVVPATTEVLFTNPGYYNPVPPPEVDNNFNQGNNFSSFIGSNMSFNLGNINTSSLFGENNITTQASQTTTSYSVNDTISSLFPSISCPPPPPSSNTPEAPSVPNYQYNSSHAPLLPPPMPPFSKTEDHYGNTTFSDSYSSNNSSFTYDISNTSTYPTAPIPSLVPPPPTTTYTSFNNAYSNPYQNSESSVSNYSVVPLTNSNSTPNEYNPAEEVENWEQDISWEPPPSLQDTPDSPPMSEKTGYTDPVEYHEEVMYAGASDVDHRVLPSLTKDSVAKECTHPHRNKDVDHRNLISLTGSPSDIRSWSTKSDEDFRTIKPTKISLDQDYRVPFIESLKLPPPPPPPKALTNESADPQLTANYDSSTNNFNLDSYSTVNPSDTFNSNLNPTRISNYRIGSNYTNANVTINTIRSEHIPRLNEPTQNKNNPTSQPKKTGLSPKKDNVESIDMDLSDDNETDVNNSFGNCFEPSSDILDDVDANNFLDNVNENLDLEDLVAEDIDNVDHPKNEADVLSFNPIFNVPPPLFEKGFPPNVPNMNIQQPPPNWNDQDPNKDVYVNFFNQESNNRVDFGSFRGRGGANRGNNLNIRGNWVNTINRGNTFHGGIPRGGMNFRGFIPRGGRRGWGFRGRGRADGVRGRGDFRGRPDFRTVRGGY